MCETTIPISVFRQFPPKLLEAEHEQMHDPSSNSCATAMAAVDAMAAGSYGAPAVAANSSFVLAERWQVEVDVAASVTCGGLASKTATQNVAKTWRG